MFHSDSLESRHTTDGLPPLSLDAEAQSKRSWQVILNGKIVEEPIASLELANAKMGVKVAYGQRPEGYDGFVIREQGGGGVVTLPYMLDKDNDPSNVYVGVVEEERLLAGGVIRNAPRGFLDCGETHQEAAVRELAEETGLHVWAGRLVLLAEGVNFNTAINNTTGVTKEGRPEGVQLYGLQVFMEELERVRSAEGGQEYVFPGSIRQLARNEAEERITGSRFIPLQAAMIERDMFTMAAAGALWAHLMARREVWLSRVC